MVVKPPFFFDKLTNEYIYLKDKDIEFHLYDTETDMIFGEINHVKLGNEWENDLFYKIITSEAKVNESTCPDCGFWLVERTPKNGGKFLGCSGYPSCFKTVGINDKNIEYEC